LIKKFLTSIYR